MKKAFLASYAVFTYAVFVLSSLYTCGWLLNRWFPKTIDSGTPGPLVPSLVVDTVLLFLFCFAHSYFARSSVKTVLRRYLPPYLERATYCLFFSLLWPAVCLLWRPLPGLVWEVTSPVGVNVMYGLFALMWAAHMFSISLLNHNEFFGLRQIFFVVRGEPYQPLPPASERSYYAAHVLLVVSLTLIPWACPTMSVGHLYLCVFLTAYNGIGAFLSHRDAGGLVELEAQAESAA